ncbi:hypothetical protein GCM10027614_27860 [Micromonospora vulcania]
MLAGGAVGDPAALGLDAAFPAGLIALLLPSMRDRDTRHAALGGAALAVAATPVLPAGLPVLLALAGPAVLAFRHRSTPAHGVDSTPAHDVAATAAGVVEHTEERSC